MPAYPHRDSYKARRVAKHALLGGIAIMLAKLAVFRLTNSAAVLAVAMDSIVNLITGVVLLYGVWSASRSGKRKKNDGRTGKVEYLTFGLEGWLILILGLFIAYVAISRLTTPGVETRIDSESLRRGIQYLGVIAAATLGLTGYVWYAGRRYHNKLLTADAAHLLADAGVTAGVIVGLEITRVTEAQWLDPAIALLITAIVLWTSWKLLWKSVTGLSDQFERQVNPTIGAILADEIARGDIIDFDNVRYRYNGPLRWVELRLLVNPDLTVRRGKQLAEQIQERIRREIDGATVVAHVEPFDGERAKKDLAVDLNAPSVAELKRNQRREDEHATKDGDNATLPQNSTPDVARSTGKETTETA